MAPEAAVKLQSSLLSAQVTQSPSTARMEAPSSSLEDLTSHELGPGVWDDVILRLGCQLCLQLPLSIHSQRAQPDSSCEASATEAQSGWHVLRLSGSGSAGGISCRQILEAVHAFYQVWG